MPNFAQIAANKPSPPVGTPITPQINGAGIVSAGLGAAQLVGNAVGMANQSLNLDQQIAPPMYDQSMKPVYTGGAAYNQAANARPQGATGGEVLSGVGTGASIGSSILPGWGTAIGAVAGGAISLIGGGARKNRQRRERNRALARARASQQQFNSADQQFRDQQARQLDYYDANNSDARLYNLFKAQY